MSSARILIIEDDEAIQMVLRRILNSYQTSYQITFCATAEEAIAHLKNARFDIVLSDYNLAGSLTGIDVLNWLREHHPEFSADNFILCTGNSEAWRLHSCVIRKPFSKNTIYECLQEERKGQ